MAEEEAKGKAAFAAGEFSEAIRHFSEAISLSPTDHVLYFNRSVAFASLSKLSESLIDAQKTVDLKPDWAKGYSRLGAAYLALHSYDDALSAYRKGLEVDPNDEALKSGLSDAQVAQAPSRGSGYNSGQSPNIFSGPELWARLTADSWTRAYLGQSDFVKIMQEIQKNPDSLNLYLKDERVMQALGVLVGAKLNLGAVDVDMPESSSLERRGRPETEPMQEGKRPEPAPQQPLMEIPQEEREQKERKAQAIKEVKAGNAAYKKKDFRTAVDKYTKAIELDGEDISFLENRAGAYLEMGRCEDFKIARALTRKGTALVKMATSAKDYEPAIETFLTARTEHRNPDTLKKLNDAKKAKKELEQKEAQIAYKKHGKVSQFSKEQKHPGAVKHYREEIKRNPKDLKEKSMGISGSKRDVLVNRGMCLNELYHRKAVEHYREVIKRNPKGPKEKSLESKRFIVFALDKRDEKRNMIRLNSMHLTKRLFIYKMKGKKHRRTKAYWLR